MSEKDLNDELKQKNQLNNSLESKDANSSASSFLDNENKSKILSKQELLKKIQEESQGLNEERVIINHRGKKPTTQNSSSIKNTRGQSLDLDTSNIKNTRKKVPIEVDKNSTNLTSKTKANSTDLNMNNLSPELQKQFAEFIRQANNTQPNFNNLNPNNFNPNNFNFTNFNPNDFNNFGGQNINDFGYNPEIFDPNFNAIFGSNNNAFEPFNENQNAIEPLNGNQPEQNIKQDIHIPKKEHKPEPNTSKPTPPPRPKSQTFPGKTPPPPLQKENKKDVKNAELENENIINNDEPSLPEIPEIPENMNIPEFPENANNPENSENANIPETPENTNTSTTQQEVQSIDEVPIIEENVQIPEQNQTDINQNQPNINNEFNYSTTSQIPESEQKDIRALVDISLEKNIEEVIAAANVNDMSATLGQAAEDLIGNKMKRNVKGWLVVLGILLLITAVVAYFWNDIFGKKINEEQASGLTITIVPSEGDVGSLDAKYIYYPGSEIKFHNGIRIGSELYRTEIREDGTQIQEENEAFAFRFRFFIEFTDEIGVEYENLIDSVIIPDEVENVIKYDETTGYYYYYRLVYPGERYVPFANSIIINTSIQNDYQGREFQIVLDYSTIVPASMDVMLGPDGIPDAPADWQEGMVFEFEQWSKN